MFVTGTMPPYVGYGIEVTCNGVQRVENESLVDNSPRGLYYLRVVCIAPLLMVLK